MSAAELFSNIIDAGWPGVEAWKEQQQLETLHLEFKQKARGPGPTPNDEDLDALATAMSAFANSEGGVLVFGVFARGQPKGLPDVVQSIVPLEQVQRFHGTIERQMAQFTDPPIAALQVRPIIKPDEPDKGVLVVYIPQSDAGPHRVARGSAKTQDRYYMRTAAGSINMHHALLATMFGRQPAARLYLNFHYNFAPHFPKVTVSIGNDGRGYADRPAVRFFGFIKRNGEYIYNEEIHWGELRCFDGWNNILFDDVTLSGGGYGGCLGTAGPSLVLYPGMEMPLGEISVSNRKPPKGLFLTAYGVVYAANMRSGNFAISKRLEGDKDPSQDTLRISLGSPDSA